MTCLVSLCFLAQAWLADHGYDRAHRDAVLGYVARESGFDPDVVSPTGACLFQWAGVRRRTILALGHGRCPPFYVQLAFADRELRTLFAGFWRSRYPAAHLRRHFGAGAFDP